MNRKEKWWFFFVRGMNLFAYRFWWLLLLLFALGVWYMYPCLLHREDLLCQQTDRIEEKANGVISALDNCCDCAPPAGTEPCNTNIAESGGRGYFEKNHDLGATAGTVNIKYDMLNIPDKMEVYYDGQLVASTQQDVSGAGILSFYYPAMPGKPRYCTVIMTAPQSGTQWGYFIGCPE